MKDNTKDIKTVPRRKSRLYRIWTNIKIRCYNPNDKGYKNYGARGIIVADIWHDFNNFEKWSLENGYRDDLSIDRIDVDGNYCPENCRWVDIYTQNNNKRSNVLLEYNGKEYTMSELARFANVPYTTFQERMNAWNDVEKAVETPCLHNRQCVDQYTPEGDFIKRWESITEAEKETGVYCKSISNCCNGRSRIGGGFIWKHATLNSPIIEKIEPYKGIKRKTIKVNQYNLSEEYIQTWESMTLAGKTLGIDISMISACCKNKLNTAGGYIWKLAN